MHSIKIDAVNWCSQVALSHIGASIATASHEEDIKKLQKNGIQARGAVAASPSSFLASFGGLEVPPIVVGDDENEPWGPKEGTAQAYFGGAALKHVRMHH